MSEVLIIHCDRCDSTNVLHEHVMSKPTERHLKMSEMVKDRQTSTSVPSVYYYTRYKMICKDCGHIVEYQK